MDTRKCVCAASRKARTWEDDKADVDKAYVLLATVADGRRAPVPYQAEVLDKVLSLLSELTGS
jgi:hypothetical protein